MKYYICYKSEYYQAKNNSLAGPYKDINDAFIRFQIYKNFTDTHHGKVEYYIEERPE